MAEPSALWCLFRVGDIVLAAEAARVVEVSRCSPVTPIPLACGHVSGLVNVRGQIAHVVDLSTRLSLMRHPAGDLEGDRTATGFRVVVRTAVGLAAFLVDEVCDVRSIPMAVVTSPPAALPAALADVTLAAARTDAAVVLLVDVDEVVGCR